MYRTIGRAFGLALFVALAGCGGAAPEIAPVKEGKPLEQGELQKQAPPAAMSPDEMRKRAAEMGQPLPSGQNIPGEQKK